VLAGRPFPGARHGDRVRDIAGSEHALLRAAHAAWTVRPGPREDCERYRPCVERSSLRLAAAAGGASDSATSAPSRTTPGSSPRRRQPAQPHRLWPGPRQTGHGHWPHPARRHQADPEGTPSALKAADRGHLRLQGMLVPESGTPPLPRGQEPGPGAGPSPSGGVSDRDAGQLAAPQPAESSRGSPYPVPGSARGHGG
jgi:hypothetical protein